jgi:hypothetical protein
MLKRFSWLKVVAENRKTILKLITEAIFGRRPRPQNPDRPDAVETVAAPVATGEAPA